MENFINKKTIEINNETIEYFRIDNDTHGNPRYVIHFLELHNDYNEAIKIARSFGGQKYRAKWFGGGIVFQSYNVLSDLSKALKGKI